MCNDLVVGTLVDTLAFHHMNSVKWKKLRKKNSKFLQKIPYNKIYISIKNTKKSLFIRINEKIPI